VPVEGVEETPTGEVPVEGVEETPTGEVPVEGVEESPPAEVPVECSPENTGEIFASDSFDQQMLDLVNEERTQVGLDPLVINEQLDEAADLHSQDQANMNIMSHTGSDGSEIDTRLQDQDTGYQYSTIGENLAAGYPDAEAAMAAWMGSDGHRENILNPNFEEIGVGHSLGENDTSYWTQAFAADITV
jgi:uncharacterized protein YkwD